MFREASDKEYAALVAENRFITDVQLEIERVLDTCGVTQAELARKAKISDARVSQILAGNGKNLQARTIARIAHTLGMRPVLKFCDGCADLLDVSAVDKNSDRFDFQKWVKSASEGLARFEPCIANDDEFELAGAA